jgi:hypothetical protein
MGLFKFPNVTTLEPYWTTIQISFSVPLLSNNVRFHMAFCFPPSLSHRLECICSSNGGKPVQFMDGEDKSFKNGKIPRRKVPWFQSLSNYLADLGLLLV